jgi:hypothetical protein
MLACTRRREGARTGCSRAERNGQSGRLAHARRGKHCRRPRQGCVACARISRLQIAETSSCGEPRPRSINRLTDGELLEAERGQAARSLSLHDEDEALARVKPSFGFPLRSFHYLCSAGSRCSTVPRRPRSYAALRLPRFLRRKAPVSPCLSPTSARALVLCLSAGSSCVRIRVARRRFLSGPPPRSFRGRYPSAHTARAPTHRRPRCRARRKARYRLGRLPFHRTGFAPAGRHTESHELIA